MQPLHTLPSSLNQCWCDSKICLYNQLWSYQNDSYVLEKYNHFFDDKVAGTFKHLHLETPYWNSRHPCWNWEYIPATPVIKDCWYGEEQYTIQRSVLLAHDFYSNRRPVVALATSFALDVLDFLFRCRKCNYMYISLLNQSYILLIMYYTNVGSKLKVGC